jgi:3-oxoadipate enol-lactonase
LDNSGYQIDLSTGGSAHPWLVLINGLFADFNSWDKLVPMLSSHFNLLRYNGRGQGSGAIFRDEIRLMDQVTDLKNLLDKTNISQASLLGLSNGGRIAFKFTEMYPQLVNSIVACDTYCELDAPLELKLKSWLQAAQTNDPVFRYNITAPWIFGETVIRNFPGVIDFYRDRASLSDGQTVVSLIESALAQHTFDLSKINCPVLLGVGDEDILTPLKLHLEIASRLSKAEVAELKGGHASILEFPDSIETKIIPFLLKNNTRL